MPEWQFRVFTSTPLAQGGGTCSVGYTRPRSIEVATTPTASDRAGAFFFDRSTTFLKSVRKRLGWHLGRTNLFGGVAFASGVIAEPSGRDRAMILNNLCEAKMEIDSLFLAVISWAGDWVGIAEGKSLRRLQAIG